MVRIPRAEFTVEPQIAKMPNLVGEGWGAPGRAMVAMGQSIGSLGDALGDVGNQINEAQQKEQWFDDQLKLYQADTEIGLAETQAQASYQGDGSDYYDSRRTFYDTKVGETLAKVAPQNQQRAQLFFEQRRGPMLEGAMRFGQGRRVESLQTKIEGVIETEVAGIAAAKPEEFDRRAAGAIAGINAAINGAYINGAPLGDDIKDKLSRNAAELMSRALLGLAVDENTAPEIIPKIKQFITNPEVFGIMGAAQPSAQRGQAPMQGYPGSPSGPGVVRTAQMGLGASPDELTARVAPEQFFAGKVPDVAKLPLGMRMSNNPTNIKYSGSAWQKENFPGLVGPSEAKDQGDPQALFANPTAGMVAAVRLAQLKQSQGMDTVRKIIADPKGWTPGYEPAAVNIAKTMGIKPDDKIDLNNPATLKSFMRALITQEHGEAGKLYDDALVDKGIQIALGGQAGQAPGTTGQMSATAKDFLRTALTDDRRKASGTTDVDNLHPVMQDRLAAFVASAKAAGHDIKIQSGARDAQRQARLWQQAVKKYGSAAEARKWVAPPGRSTHNDGMAVDLAYGDRGSGLGGKKTAAVAWAHENAGKFGLSFPLGHEDWHIEPAEARAGGRRYANAGDLQAEQKYWRPDMGGANNTIPRSETVQVADAGNYQGWRPVDAHLREMLTKQLPQLERLERGILARAEATEKAEQEAFEQRVRKEATDLWIEGKLTREWVQSYREILPASTYESLMEKVVPTVRSTDYVVLSDLMERADEDPDTVLEEADKAFAQRRLTREDVILVRQKVDKFMKPDTRQPQWVREYRSQIKRLIRPAVQDRNPETMKRYGETLERFDRFWDEQEQIGKGGDRKAVADFSDRIVKEHRTGLVEDRRKDLALPRFSQVSREGLTAEEIDNAIQRTTEAIKAGKLSRDEAQAEAALLREWRRVLEADAAANGKTLKPSTPPAAAKPATPGAQPATPGEEKKPEAKAEPKPAAKPQPTAKPVQPRGAPSAGELAPEEEGDVVEPPGKMFLGGPKPKPQAQAPIRMMRRLVRDENGVVTGVIDEPYNEAAE